MQTDQRQGLKKVWLGIALLLVIAVVIAIVATRKPKPAPEAASPPAKPVEKSQVAKSPPPPPRDEVAKTSPVTPPVTPPAVSIMEARCRASIPKFSAMTKQAMGLQKMALEVKMAGPAEWATVEKAWDDSLTFARKAKEYALANNCPTVAEEIEASIKAAEADRALGASQWKDKLAAGPNR